MVNDTGCPALDCRTHRAFHLFFSPSPSTRRSHRSPTPHCCLVVDPTPVPVTSLPPFRPPSLATRWGPRQRQQRCGKRPSRTAIIIIIITIVVVPVEDGVPRAGGAGGPQNVVRVDAGLPAAGGRGGRDVLGESGAPTAASRHCCDGRCCGFVFSSESRRGGWEGRWWGVGTLEAVRRGAGWGGGRDDEGGEELVGVGGARRGADRPLAVFAIAESRRLR